MSKTVRDLQDQLVRREHLPLRYAGILAVEVFGAFSDRVREGVMLWMDDRLPQDFAVAGVSVGKIMSDIGATAFEALCMLNVFEHHAGISPKPVWFLPYDRIVSEPDE